MPQEIRLTLHGLRVLKLFCKDPAKWLAGADVAASLNLANGTLYPLLYRLEAAGLLSGKWEKGNPGRLKRPLKRYYRITELGTKRFLFEESRP